MARALVISGGGSKGAFAVGVLLEQYGKGEGLRFSHYIGTSTGALIVPLAALGEMALLEQLYTTVHTHDIVTKFNIGERLFTHSLFDSTPLWNLITHYYHDDRCLQLLEGVPKIYLITTCLQTRRLTVFTNDTQAKTVPHYHLEQITDPLQLRKALLASASQPVFMPPVKVNSHVKDHPFPRQQFVDGGILQYAGIEMAIDQGCREVQAILLAAAQEAAVQQEFKDLYGILKQTIDIFMTDVAKNDLIIPQQYNEALRYIAEVKQKMLKSGLTPADIDSYFRIGSSANPFEGKQPVAISLIRPEQPLGGGPGGLEFNPAEMRQMIEMGKQAAKESL